MPNRICGASSEHIKRDELEIDLRSQGVTFARAVAKDVWLTVYFSYERGQKERFEAGMPEDFNEPEETNVEVTAIKARNSVQFIGDCGDVHLQQGMDMTPFLTGEEIEGIEADLLKRAEAN